MNEDAKALYKARKARRMAKASTSLVAAAEAPRCPWCNCGHFRIASIDTKDFMFRGKPYVTVAHRRVCNHCGRSWTRVVSEGPKAQPPTPPPAPPRVKKKVKVSAPIYRPTKEEIRAACEEIQRGWSAAERRRRSRLAQAPFTFPRLNAMTLESLD